MPQNCLLFLLLCRYFVRALWLALSLCEAWFLWQTLHNASFGPNCLVIGCGHSPVHNLLECQKALAATGRNPGLRCLFDCFLLKSNSPKSAYFRNKAVCIIQVWINSKTFQGHWCCRSHTFISAALISSANSRAFLTLRDPSYAHHEVKVGTVCRKHFCWGGCDRENSVSNQGSLCSVFLIKIYYGRFEWIVASHTAVIVF